MNWQHQMNSILSEADGSVAKIRERLTARSPTGIDDVYPAREVSAGSDLKLSSPLSSDVHWYNLTTIHTQLQQQNQAIKTLTKSVHLLERERNAQQRMINILQEDQRKLQIRLEKREMDCRPSSTGSDRLLEQWKRERDRELSSMRDHINRTISLGNHEESFSSKCHREELEHLRIEIDIVKSKLMQQEEDMYHLRSETRETKLQNEHNTKMLKKFTDSHRTQSFEVSQMVSQHKHIQEEMCELRGTASELKDELRGFILRDNKPTIVQNCTKAAVTIEPVLSIHVLSGSEDEFSLTPSLSDVSSDESDTYWQEETVVKTKSRHRQAHLNSGSDLSGELKNRAEGFDRDLNTPPDLSLNDF